MHSEPRRHQPRGRLRRLARSSAAIGNLSETDLARLINLYRQLSALEMALMLSDDKLAPKLDRFSADHRMEFRTPFRQYAALVGYAVAGVAAVAWAAMSAS